VFCFVPQMRDLGGTDRMVYMTHSWLMSFFLNCPCSDLTPGQAESPTCTALGLNTPSDFAPALLCPTRTSCKKPPADSSFMP
jgi:hypothetical protein